jgi:tripartite-type tricarboxylate transporter receptor subunit TctC
MVHIAYKGPAAGVQDVIAGHVQTMFTTAASVAGVIRAGRVRALAVTTLQRAATLPEVPTMDELGIKGFDAGIWHGLVAPAGTPKDYIDTLNFTTVEALKDPATRRALQRLGVNAAGSTPKEFADYIESETAKWAAVIRTSGAYVD